jgi:outer membrane protein OmpA-like peptidoglycan-associated protein
MRKTAFFAFVMILICSAAFAQNNANDFKVPTSVGLYGGINLNMHKPGLPENQPVFNLSTNSLTLNIGLIGNFPINRTFVFSGRIGYNPLSAVLEGNTTSVPPEIDASLGYLEISPVMQFHNLLPIKPLYFLAGVEVGVPMTKSYTVALYPLPGGAIPSANIRAALAVGAGYMLKLSPRLYLTPEVSFRLPFTQISGDATMQKWSASQLRLGVSLTYSFDKEEEASIPPNDYYLNVGFNEVRYFNNDGSTAPIQSIKVEDVQYTELYPFIPYVFLDEKIVEPQSDAQVLYGKSESGEFTIQKLEPDALKINMSTLDVIGARMIANPSAELTITGTNDGKNEKDLKDLALQRAIYAKDYLVENYNINPELINVRGSGIPAKPSAQKVEDGIAENRRIEFSSSNPELFRPILIEGENQRIAEPSLLEFIPTVSTNDSITSWNIEVTQSDKILRENSGANMPPSVQWSIRPNELTNKQIPVDYKLVVRTANGLEKTANGSIPTEYFSSSRKRADELPDRTVSKYSLILFDFDKAEVSAADKEIIEKYILPAIKFNSTIKIYGYTDRIGEEKYNQGLSLRRANAVKDIIQSKMKDVKVDVFGVGENVPIFDNDVPAGRQLSRTVQVHVITPK